MKPALIMTRILLVILFVVGFLGGTFGGLADISLTEQRLCRIYGYSAAIFSLIAFHKTFSKGMSFKLQTKEGKFVYIFTSLSATATILLTTV